MNQNLSDYFEMIPFKILRSWFLGVDLDTKINTTFVAQNSTNTYLLTKILLYLLKIAIDKPYYKSYQINLVLQKLEMLTGQIRS